MRPPGNAGPCSSAPSPTHHIHRDSGKELSSLETGKLSAPRQEGSTQGMTLELQGGTPKPVQHIWHTPRAGEVITSQDNRGSAKCAGPSPGALLGWN